MDSNGLLVEDRKKGIDQNLGVETDPSSEWKVGLRMKGVDKHFEDQLGFLWFLLGQQDSQVISNCCRLMTP